MAPDTTYRHMPGKLKINYINGGCGFPQDNQAQTQNERLIFLYSGGLFCNSPGQKLYAEAPALILIPAGAHSPFTAPVAHYELFWADFTLLCGNFRLFERFEKPVCAPVQDAPAIFSLFKSIIHPAPHPLSGPLKQKSALLKIISSMGNIFTDNIKYENYEQRIAVVLEYIEQNLGREIKIEELAALWPLHPNYFIRFFKSQTGLPPMAYIANARLNKARGLLKDTDIPMNEIAAGVGISDYSYFSRQFKKATGYTPSQYRRLMKAQAAPNNPEL